MLGLDNPSVAATVIPVKFFLYCIKANFYIQLQLQGAVDTDDALISNENNQLRQLRQLNSAT
jgi:hypothetical protein